MSTYYHKRSIMNAIYALVLFLVVITSMNDSVSCTFSKNGDKEIGVAVKDHQTPTTISVTEDDIQYQFGRFKYKDGNILTLLRHMNGAANCVGFGEKCAWWYEWCCGELHCVNGHCAHHSDCLPLHTPCHKGAPSCCYPYDCIRDHCEE